jgi:hypothetical protein
MMMMMMDHVVVTMMMMILAFAAAAAHLFLDGRDDLPLVPPVLLLFVCYFSSGPLPLFSCQEGRER